MWGRKKLLTPDLIAHGAARHAQGLPPLRRHPRGHAYGRNAPGLRHHDARVATHAAGDGVLQQELGHLEGM